MNEEKNITETEKLELIAKAIILTTLIVRFFQIPEQQNSITQLTCFVLFIFLFLTDMFKEKYISLPISFFGAFIFNPIYRFGITDSTWNSFEPWLILIVNIWLISDICRLFSNRIFSLPKPWLIKKARFNEETGKYEILSCSYIYEVPPYLMSDLEEYLQKSNIATLADWHYKLPDEDKTKIIKRIFSPVDFPINSKQKIAFR